MYIYMYIYVVCMGQFQIMNTLTLYSCRSACH